MTEKKVEFIGTRHGLSGKMYGKWVDTTVGADNGVKAIIIDDHGGVQAVDLNHVTVIP